MIIIQTHETKRRGKNWGRVKSNKTNPIKTDILDRSFFRFKINGKKININAIATNPSLKTKDEKNPPIITKFVNIKYFNRLFSSFDLNIICVFLFFELKSQDE